MVLICISQVTEKVEHFFICIFTIHPSSLASPEKEGRLLEGCDINTESERMNRSKLGKGGGERLPDKGNKQPVQSLEATKSMSLRS